MAIDHAHGEVDLTANLAGRFLQLHLLLLLLPFILAQEEALIAVEALLLGDGLHSVAGLMEAGVAGVAVKHWILIVAFGAEADLAVGLEEALHLLQTGVALRLLLLLQTDLFYHRHLQRVLQHQLSLIRMTPLEADQYLSHSQLLS